MKIGHLALAALCGSMMAQAVAPVLKLKGISIGERRDRVAVSLQKSAAMEREEEGEQVWKTKNDTEVSYVLVGYDRDRHVRYVTLLAKAGAVPKCDAVGEIASAARTGSPGNYTYTRKLRSGNGSQVIAIAKGADTKHLSSCSIKRVGAQGEDDD